MSAGFLDAARQGRNSAWRYLLGILLSLVCWFLGLFIVGIPLGLLVVGQVAISGKDLDSGQIGVQLEQALRDSAVLSYVLNSAPFLFLCIGIFIVVKTLHCRRFRTLISFDASICWRRLFSGFAVWFLIASIQTVIEFWLKPQDFVWSFHSANWLAFLPIALVLTPIQTSAEELLFRGYLLQGLGLIVRQPVVLALVSSLPFALVHFGNPEMQRGAGWVGMTYFALAVFLGLITLKDNRLELALGVHAANNLFIVLLVNSTDSVLRSPAILTQTTPTDPRVTFISLLIAIVVFYYLFFGRQQKGNQPGVER